VVSTTECIWVRQCPAAAEDQSTRT
jgi:hypothetical protein